MIYHGKSGTLSDLEKAVRETTKSLKPYAKEWDSIAVRGMSGVVVGSPVALRLKKPLVIVRKKTEDCHAGSMMVNRKQIGKRVLFLDDFTASGSTRKAVQEEVLKEGGEVVAQYLYQDKEYQEL